MRQGIEKTPHSNSTQGIGKKKYELPGPYLWINLDDKLKKISKIISNVKWRSALLWNTDQMMYSVIG